MKSIEELGFSKINIGLAITGKREDGYHNIDSIFCSTRLGDSLYFTKHHSVVFSGSAPELPQYIQDLIPYDESNLALKALRSVQTYTRCKLGAAIHLLKRVPAAAGLGGGSANAASMILGINRFWDLQLTEQEMLDLATPLGADVAFFMQGGIARGTGIGNQLKSLPQFEDNHWLLLIKPNISVSTAKAYSEFEGKSEATSKTIDAVEAALHENNMQEAFKMSRNTFEELLFPLYPELEACKRFFVERGFQTIMTGSGPTMVVLLDKAMDAFHLQEEVKKAGHDWLTLITKTK